MQALIQAQRVQGHHASASLSPTVPGCPWSRAEYISQLRKSSSHRCIVRLTLNRARNNSRCNSQTSSDVGGAVRKWRQLPGATSYTELRCILTFSDDQGLLSLPMTSSSKSTLLLKLIRVAVKRFTLKLALASRLLAASGPSGMSAGASPLNDDALRPIKKSASLVNELRSKRRPTNKLSSLCIRSMSSSSSHTEASNTGCSTSAATQPLCSILAGSASSHKWKGRPTRPKLISTTSLSMPKRLDRAMHHAEIDPRPLTPLLKNIHTRIGTLAMLPTMR
mmetsp:Transcript_108829/g.306686  ORF Transcript_108829/g.306686 Transcript_108829/m.306686 type:complete len:279 (-) Transcript_108829:32-868(-)